MNGLLNRARLRIVASALVSAAMLAACSVSTTSSHQQTASLDAAPVTSQPALAAGQDAWVSVSVATLWRTPASARPVDQPALQRPARIRQWLAALSLTQRRNLNGRADTQALLGERVRVLRMRGSWSKVVVPDQPSQLDARGYPGWVPSRQLTARPPATTPEVVTVTTRTAWLRTDDPSGTKVFEISFGTRLPYLGTVGTSIRVRTPLGAVRRVSAAAVTVHGRTEPALAPTRRHLVRTAQLFTGLPYLWAGVSGFGLDCSGLTWLDYRAHGLRIPRDAAPQATHGVPVRVSELRKGDLVFYATSGVVHHVAMYAGGRLIVQAPHTGAVVETVPLSFFEYAGARRYLR